MANPSTPDLGAMSQASGAGEISDLGVRSPRRRRIHVALRLRDGRQDRASLATAVATRLPGFHLDPSAPPIFLDAAEAPGGAHEMVVVRGSVEEGREGELRAGPDVINVWHDAPDRRYRPVSHGDGHADGIELEGKRVVLLLQGGGALGAYQVGAHAALVEECDRQRTRIDWVGGISIGAINAAVIAGPRCGDARKELKSLWDDILPLPFPPFDYTAVARWMSPFLPFLRLASLAPKWWNWTWTAFNPFGHRNFFSSRVMNPLLNPWCQQWVRRLRRDDLGFYGTDRLRRTLNRHVSWDSINAKDEQGRLTGTRLSLGAARVTTGKVVCFDNACGREISAEHVMASGALPPAFPPVRVKDPGIDDHLSPDDTLYWDGGVSSNTPIDWLVNGLMDGNPDRNTIVFLIDLWDRKGPKPRSMDEVCWRQKSIQYGSRKGAAKAVVREYQLRLQLGLPENAKSLEVYQIMYERSDHDGPQFAFSDADFSRSTYERMFDHGYADTKAALRSPQVVPVGEPAIQDDRAVLYRYGTLHKHRSTGRRDAWRREQQWQAAKVGP